MTDKKDVPPPAVEPEGADSPEFKPKDADSPAAKPHGTLNDQVSTMEGEGQAQPQADELPPE